MEGIDLHPEVDERGVHWFHRHEVDELAKNPRSHEFEQPSSARCRKSAAYTSRTPVFGNWLAHPARDNDRAAEPESSASSAAAQARAWAEQAHAAALAIREEREQAARAAETARIAELKDREERGRLTDAREALIDELDGYSKRELRRLGPELLDEILYLLRDD